MKAELECQLETKASAELEKSVAEELSVPDKPMEELLNESSNADRDTREGDSSTE